MGEAKLNFIMDIMIIFIDLCRLHQDLKIIIFVGMAIHSFTVEAAWSRPIKPNKRISETWWYARQLICLIRTFLLEQSSWNNPLSPHTMIVTQQIPSHVCKI